MTLYSLRAEFEMFDSSRGGLDHELRSPIRSLHVEPFETVAPDGVPIEHLGVFIDVDGGPVVRPGARGVTAVFGFFNERARDVVHPGSEFYVTAGRRRVGRGRLGVETAWRLGVQQAS